MTDYLDDDEASRRVRRRDLARARGGGAVIDPMRAKQRPNADFYDARQVLAFEAEHPGNIGGKSELIRRRFNCTQTRYQQRLYQLIHDDEANARRIDAATVNRLQRLDAEHIAARLDRLQGVSDDRH